VRIAVLSDIHGNLEALEAVLAEVDRSGVDLLYSLGDIVGYGPSPAACIEIVRRRAAVSLTGNHDAAVAGLTSLEDFNEFARSAVEWTAAHLDGEQIEYLGRSATRTGSLNSCSSTPRRSSRSAGTISTVWPTSTIVSPRSPSGCASWGTRTGRPSMSAAAIAARCGTVARIPAAGLRYLVNAGAWGSRAIAIPGFLCPLRPDERVRRSAARRLPVERTQERMRAAGLPHS